MSSHRTALVDLRAEVALGLDDEPVTTPQIQRALRFLDTFPPGVENDQTALERIGRFHRLEGPHACPAPFGNPATLWERVPIVRIDLAVVRLGTCQFHLGRAHLQRAIVSPHSTDYEPGAFTYPLCALVDGVVWIRDGHHRVGADLILGRRTMLVRLYDQDRYGPDLSKPGKTQMDWAADEDTTPMLEPPRGVPGVVVAAPRPQPRLSVREVPAPAGRRTVAATLAGEPVGYLSWSGAGVRAVLVRPGYRRSGVAPAMLLRAAALDPALRILDAPGGGQETGHVAASDDLPEFAIDRMGPDFRLVSVALIQHLRRVAQGAETISLAVDAELPAGAVGRQKFAALARAAGVLPVLAEAAEATVLVESARDFERYDAPRTGEGKADVFGDGAGTAPTLVTADGQPPKTATRAVVKYVRQTADGYEDVEREVEGPFYHGGRAKLSPGDELRPGFKTNPWGDEGPKSTHVHITSNGDTAAQYAEQTRGRLYEVEPAHPLKPGYQHDEYKTQHPVRVVREIPRKEWPSVRQPKTAAAEPDRVPSVAEVAHQRFLQGMHPKVRERYDTMPDADKAEVRKLMYPEPQTAWRGYKVHLRAEHHEQLVQQLKDGDHEGAWKTIQEGAAAAGHHGVGTWWAPEHEGQGDTARRSAEHYVPKGWDPTRPDANERHDSNAVGVLLKGKVDPAHKRPGVAGMQWPDDEPVDVDEVHLSRPEDLGREPHERDNPYGLHKLDVRPYTTRMRPQPAKTAALEDDAPPPKSEWLELPEHAAALHHVVPEARLSFRKAPAGHGMTHRLSVSAPDPADPHGQQVAHLQWSADTGAVDQIKTEPGWTRRGVATAVWDVAHRLADEHGVARPVHSESQTEDGAAWAGSLPQRQGAGRPVSWDQITERHPDTYGVDHDEEEGDSGPGEEIAQAAGELAFDRPDEPTDDGAWHHASELHWSHQHVDPKHVDYARHGLSDSRVRHAYEGFKAGHDVPPVVLVHRHGVYQVADGHHRAEAAHHAGVKLPAYVARSPHHDVPFSADEDGEQRKAPFHGAEPIPVQKTAAENPFDPEVRRRRREEQDRLRQHRLSNPPPLVQGAGAQEIYLREHDLRQYAPLVPLEHASAAHAYRSMMESEGLGHLLHDEPRDSVVRHRPQRPPRGGEGGKNWSAPFHEHVEGRPRVGLALHPDMYDELTVTHETAHVVTNGGRPGAELGHDHDTAHGPEWLANYRRLVHTHLRPEVGEEFDRHFHPDHQTSVVRDADGSSSYRHEAVVKHRLGDTGVIHPDHISGFGDYELGTTARGLARSFSDPRSNQFGEEGAAAHRALVEDVRRNGVRKPVVIDEHGDMIEGHHRAAAAAEVGVHVPYRVGSWDDVTEDEQRKWVPPGWDAERSQRLLKSMGAAKTASAQLKPGRTIGQEGDRTSWAQTYLHPDGELAGVAHLAPTHDGGLRITRMETMQKGYLRDQRRDPEGHERLRAAVLEHHSDKHVSWAGKVTPRHDMPVSAEERARHPRLPAGLRYEEVETAEPSRRKLRAVVGDQEVGHISWGDTSRHGDGQVDMLETHPDHQRRGVASTLWHRARQIDPGVRHSEVQTPDGSNWAEQVDRRSRTAGADHVPDDKWEATVAPTHWYHGSPRQLADGTDLIPGHESHKPDGDHQHVWVTDDPHQAAKYGDVYEVEPGGTPVAQGAAGEYRVPAARVRRSIGDPRLAPVKPTGRGKPKFRLEQSPHGTSRRVVVTHHGREVGHLGWDDEGVQGEFEHPDYPGLGGQMREHARAAGHHLAVVEATAATERTFDHVEEETGGSKWPTRVTLRAHVGGRQVGFLRYLTNQRGTKAMVDTLQVDPEHQRQGHASALMDELHRRHPGSIDHGDRTDPGKAWWDRYRAGRPVSRGRVQGAEAPAIGATGSAPRVERGVNDHIDWAHELGKLKRGVHRGVRVTLPPHVHELVHDKLRASPDQQAQAIVDHLRQAGGLGAHWTAEEKVAHGFAKAHGTGMGDGETSVVLHAATPSPEHVDPRPKEDEGRVYPFDDVYGDVHGNIPGAQREVPLRSGAPVHITGVTWYQGPRGRKVRGEVRSDGPQHVASVRAPAEPEIQVEAAGKVYFHGTTNEMKPGDHVLPASQHGGHVTFNSDTSRDHAYATGTEDGAWDYAEKSHAWKVNAMPRGPFPVPRVYEVEPVDHRSVEQDPQGRGNREDDVRSPHGFRVRREVPMPEHMGEPDDWRS